MSSSFSFSLFGIFACLGFLGLVLSQATDETLQPNAEGNDVSDAVVRKIQRSGIFSFDQNLLRRIGFVETSFGFDPKTYRPGYYGGIWQVDEDMFNQTKILNDPTVFSNISATWNIEWNTTTWDDLLKPFYSGLAARLFLHRLVSIGRPIPGTVTNQAMYWVNNYRNNGSANLFVERVRVLESDENVCEGMMDIAIVLDGSGSIGSANFEQAKVFVASLVETFNLNTTRVALIKYSTTVETIFDFNNTLTMQQMTSTIRTMSYPNGATNTTGGLNRAVELYNQTALRPGVPRLLATFTDGMNTVGGLPSAVINVRDAGLLSFAVGIGSETVFPELLQIALLDPARVFEVNDYNALAEFFYQMKSVTCEIPQEPDLGKEQEGQLKRNEKRYFKYQIPDIGFTATLSTNGSFSGWYSYSEETPNSAVNDGVLGAATFIPNPISKQTVNATVYLAIQSNSIEAMTYKIGTQEGYHVPNRVSQSRVGNPFLMAVVLLIISFRLL